MSGAGGMGGMELRAARLRVAAARWLRGGEEAALTPPSGVIARLVMFSAAAMSFLAVIAAGFGLAADRLADRWAQEIASAATVRISAPAGDLEDAVAAVLRALETTPGVAAARPLDDAEQRALLTPWLGEDAPIEALSPPRLIAVTLAGDGPDPAGLRDRLTMELSGTDAAAVYDDHSRWRRPLLRSASALRRLAWGAVALCALSAAAMVTLAARATLASNRLVVDTLRLLGATNDFIARAFVRRYTLRAAGGGALGAALGALALDALPPLGGDGALAMAPGLTGAGWLVVPATPAICAAVAYIATRVSVLSALRRAG